MSEDPLHLLCIEPRFPGRLGAVADWLVRNRGYRCRFYCAVIESREHWPLSVGKGLEVSQFKVGGVARETAVPWKRHLERGLCYAYSTWELVESQHPRPVDAILARSANMGSSLFLPVSLGRVPVVSFFDYFFHAHHQDLAEEMGPSPPVEYFHWRRAANAMDLLDLENCSTAWAPTEWQRDQFPLNYRDDFMVLHDGVDTQRFQKTLRPERMIAGRPIPSHVKVITFISQRLDRIRGFDRFMKLAERLLRVQKDLLFVVVGGSPVLRSMDVLFFNTDYGAHVLAESAPVDPEKFWFLGNVTHGTIAEVLIHSDLHVYPSRSYAVSRSVLEALAAGALVMAWDNAPIREFIEPNKNGLLVPENDPDAWTKTALAALKKPRDYQELKRAAVEGMRNLYGQDVTLPRLARVLTRLANRIDRID